VIARIPAVQFTYDIWRAGSLMELGIPHREWSITLNRHLIRDMAVGFTEGFRLHVRPKPDYIAVMFFVKDRHFWTHLTKKEFTICFPELKDGND
jgi:hypothetical protein